MVNMRACLPELDVGMDMDATLSSVLEIKIPADMRYVSLVRRGIRSLAESAGFSCEDVADIMLAVSEAVTNSVEHGSPEPDRCGVLVKCSAFAERMVVEIEDEGDACSLPECTSLNDCACERGRGILMMRELMDECEDSRTERGMRVRMAKQKSVRINPD